jgi:hypothetical protein
MLTVLKTKQQPKQRQQKQVDKEQTFSKINSNVEKMLGDYYEEKYSLSGNSAYSFSRKNDCDNIVCYRMNDQVVIGFGTSIDCDLVTVYFKLETDEIEFYEKTFKLEDFNSKLREINIAVEFIEDSLRLHYILSALKIKL